MMHTGIQLRDLPPDTTVVHSASLAVVFLPGVLEEVISISLWPAVEIGLPDQPTHYEHTITYHYSIYPGSSPEPETQQ